MCKNTVVQVKSHRKNLQEIFQVWDFAYIRHIILTHGAYSIKYSCHIPAIFHNLKLKYFAQTCVCQMNSYQNSKNYYVILELYQN